MTGNDRSLRAKVLGSLGLAQNVGSDVVSKISEYGIGARFHLLGPTRDISAAYSAFDVLAFPSHLKAAGRPVFEAAFAGRPSIVAVENPKPDTLVHGETGLSIPEKSPKAIAEAICYLADNRAISVKMGQNARLLAEKNFNPILNSARLLELYRSVHRGSVVTVDDSGRAAVDIIPSDPDDGGYTTAVEPNLGLVANTIQDIDRGQPA